MSFQVSGGKVFSLKLLFVFVSTFFCFAIFAIFGRAFWYRTYC